MTRFSEHELSVCDYDDIEMAVERATRSREFRELRDEIRMGRVVLFAGPGVSRAVGLGTSDKVAESLAWKIARRLDLDDDPVELVRLKGLGLYSLVDLYAHLFGPAQFQQAVCEAFYEACPDRMARLELHTLLLQVPFAMIVSTTWDDLFEQAAQKLEPPRYLSPITHDDDLLGLYATQEQILIQPHGSLRTGNAFSVDDYAYDVRHPALSSFLRSLFLTHKMLFVGYDVNDTDLVHYYNVFRLHFGEQAQKLWAQSYILGLGSPKAGLERLRQMGLRVLDFQMSSGDGEEDAGAREFEAMRRFLRCLYNETRTNLTQVERTRRMAEFMSETEYARRTIRVRANISPIGLPEREQLQQLEPSFDLAEVCPYVGVEQEYEQQKCLKDNFLHVIQAAVSSDHDVRLILAVDFEALQQRTVHKKWLELQLRNLIEFFERGLGASPHVKVVDRKGTYEIQQYIFDDREMVDSRKFDLYDPRYYQARVTKNPQEVQAAVDVYDLCFTGIAVSNLESLLTVDKDRGRQHLVECVYRALSDSHATGVLREGPALESHRERLGGQLRSLENPSRHDVETLLCTAPSHRVMAAISEDVVFEAIKLHLLDQWKHELGFLGETRTSWLIQVTDREGNPKGDIDKWTYLTEFCGEHPLPLYNLHVVGFVLTHDARHLLLRKRVCEDILFDPGRWDRSVHGHVRQHSSYNIEFQTEVLHHFGTCGVRTCNFVTPRQFLDQCRERRSAEANLGLLGKSAFYGTELLALVLHADAIPDTYDRVRASDGATVREMVRSRLYLGLLPTAELPQRDPTGKHFVDWALLPVEQVRPFLETDQAVSCETCLSGQTEIHAEDLTHEARKLLKICYDEVLAKLVS
jgi:hypothetical protein